MNKIIHCNIIEQLRLKLQLNISTLINRGQRGVESLKQVVKRYVQNDTIYLRLEKTNLYQKEGERKEWNGRKIILLATFCFLSRVVAHEFYYIILYMLCLNYLIKE